MSTNPEPPEAYVRINITKQAKGYVHETTVSLRWHPEVLDTGSAATPFPDIADQFGVRQEMPDNNGALVTPSSFVLAHLLQDADRLAREEIDRRTTKDLERAP